MPANKHEEQVRPRNLSLFNARIENQPQDKCWLWDGSRTPDGYGYIKQAVLPLTKPRKSINIFVHRLAFLQAFGSIPEGFVIDHLCHDPAVCEGGPSCLHRRCVNPAHLAAVDDAENKSRSVMANVRGTCRNGLHAWEGVNIRTWPSGKSVCLPCHRETTRRNNRKAVA